MPTKRHTRKWKIFVILSTVVILIIVCGIVLAGLPLKNNPLYYARKEREVKASLTSDIATQFNSANAYFRTVDVNFAADSKTPACPDGPFSGTSPCTVYRVTIPDIITPTAAFKTGWAQSALTIDTKLKQDGWTFYADIDYNTNKTLLITDLFNSSAQTFRSVTYARISPKTHNQCSIYISYDESIFKINESCHN